jgi:hypothetical protein
LCSRLTPGVEICEDIEEECEKYGKILEMKIPRPSGGSRQSAGVGKIYIKYDTPESAKKALQALAGRKFADRTVVTTYFDEVRNPEKSPCPLSNVPHRQASRLMDGSQHEGQPTVVLFKILVDRADGTINH